MLDCFTLCHFIIASQRYYRCILTGLKKLDLEAVVILYYPTYRAPNQGLPGPLKAQGGWLNYTTVEAFQDYAALCYEQLGSLVSNWITINEPNRLVDIFSSEREKHQATRHLLLSHARAWRLYEREYSNKYSAKVSLALQGDWAEPANPFLDSHSTAAQRFLLFELGRFLDPLLGAKYEEEHHRGNYPHLEKKSQIIGLPGSSVPNFTKTETEEIRGSLSFIALTHYTTRLVSPYPHTQADSQHKQPPDHGCLTLTDPTWPSSSMRQALVPWGLRRILDWVNQRYGGVLPIILTASGVDDQDDMEDKTRQYFLRSYLQEALKGETQKTSFWSLSISHSIRILYLLKICTYLYIFIKFELNVALPLFVELFLNIVCHQGEHHLNSLFIYM